MGVEKKMDFHRALGDAYYTACILQKIEDKYIFPNSSLDVYQNPKSKREEIHISYPTYDKPARNVHCAIILPSVRSVGL